MSATEHEPQAIQRLLSGSSVPLLRGMSDEELKLLLSQAREQHHAPGDILVAQGDRLAEMLILVAGLARVTTRDLSTNDERPLAEFGPGACVGEMSLLTGDPASATVTAATPCRTLVVDSLAFETTIERSATFSRNVSAILAERLRFSNRRWAALAETVFVPFYAPADRWEEAQRIALELGASVTWHTRKRVLVASLRLTEGPSLFNRFRSGAPALCELLADGTLVRRHERGAVIDDDVLSGVVVIEDSLAAEPRLAGAADGLFKALTGSYDYILALLPGEQPVTVTTMLSQARRVLALAGEGVSPEPRSVAHAAATNTDRGAAAVRVLLADRATQPSQGELARLRQAHEDLAVSVLPGLRDAHPEDGLLVTRARGTAAEQGIGRLARDIAGLRVGIALGAGSNKGYAHITALEALERAGVPVDFLTGCSVGSIVGALRSLHEPPAEIAQLLDAAAQHTFRPTVPVRSLISSDSLARFIRREGRGRGFADAFEPMAIVAADLVTRQEVVFRRGPYWRAIMASISIPGIFPPVQVGHHFLTDGGILNPVPTSVAAAMGADVVIGVKLARPPDAPEALEAARERPRKLTIVEVLQRSSEMMQSKIVDESASRATIIIEPRWPATLSSGLRDFSRGRQFMPYGAEAAEAALPRLRTVLPWLHRIRT